MKSGKYVILPIYLAPDTTLMILLLFGTAVVAAHVIDWKYQRQHVACRSTWVGKSERWSCFVDRTDPLTFVHRVLVLRLTRDCETSTML